MLCTEAASVTSHETARHFLHDRLQVDGIATGDHHVCPALGERESDGLPEPSASTCDDGHFAIQIEHRISLPI
jgi:hypothetical protein